MPEADCSCMFPKSLERQYECFAMERTEQYRARKEMFRDQDIVYRSPRAYHAVELFARDAITIEKTLSELTEAHLDEIRFALELEKERLGTVVRFVILAETTPPITAKAT